MPFGNDIRFKLSGDTTELERSFSRAEAVAERAGRKMGSSMKQAGADKATGLTSAQAQALDRQYRADVERVAAERAIKEFRRDQAFMGENAQGKIRMLGQEITQLEARRAKQIQGSTRELQLQLEIEKKRAEQKQIQTDTERGDGGGKGGGLGIGALAFRAIGGALAFGLERAIAWQQSRISLAQTQEQTTGEGLASMRARIAATGGLSGQLRQGQGTMKDLESQKAFEQSRVDFLQSGAQGMVSAMAPGELLKSEQSIAHINAQLQKQHDANALIERDLNRQTAIRNAMLDREAAFGGGRGRGPGGVRDIGSITLGKEIGALPDTERARSAGQLNELTRQRIELARLKKVLDAETRFGTPESRAEARLAVRAQEGEIVSGTMGMEQRRRDLVRGFAADAAGGRTFRNGAARPRSETERLAQQAQRFRERARNAILTGAAGEVQPMLDAAVKTEGTVAGRLMAATSQVTQPRTGDLSALKAELKNANTILKSIDKSLTPKNAGNGGKK